MDEDGDYDPADEQEQDSQQSPRSRSKSIPTATVRHHSRGVEDFYNAEWDPEEHSTSTDSDADHSESQGLKRHANDDDADDAASRPFKRHKSTLNADYLDLLNKEIVDASHRACLDNHDNFAPSQIGMIRWSPAEKIAFFEALARLGKHDIEGISRLIGSKSALEVRQFVVMFQDATDHRRRNNSRGLVSFSEHPAAVELSQHCSHSLEDAADDISLRQEMKEEQREKAKWGAMWNLTPELASSLRQTGTSAGDEGLPSLGLFNLPKWLSLSRAVFMNSAIPGNNWTYISHEEPSIWATTFEDFYSLVVSVTRRLVQTIIFASLSRIKSRSESRPVTRMIVKQGDVRAAVLSLGMDLNTKKFWRRSARRLRLDVYEEVPLADEDSEIEPLSFDEVENLLADDTEAGEDNATSPVAELEPEFQSLDESESDASSETSDVIDDVKEEEIAIRKEMDEVLRYSVADFPTSRYNDALEFRITLERKEERHAEHCDEYASFQEETEMWNLLQKEPPFEVPKTTDPQSVGRTTLDVESLYPLGRDWSKKLEYQAEWETRK